MPENNDKDWWDVVKNDEPPEEGAVIRRTRHVPVSEPLPPCPLCLTAIGLFHGARWICRLIVRRPPTEC